MFAKQLGQKCRVGSTPTVTIRLFIHGRQKPILWSYTYSYPHSGKLLRTVTRFVRDLRFRCCSSLPKSVRRKNSNSAGCVFTCTYGRLQVGCTWLFDSAFADSHDDVSSLYKVQILTPFIERVKWYHMIIYVW